MHSPMLTTVWAMRISLAPPAEPAPVLLAP